jgi:hypothetical protein
MTEEWFKKLNPYFYFDMDSDSIPAYTAGIDEPPIDFVPDADTPEKLMKLYERGKDEL